MKAVEEGKFARFKGAGHISATAARKLVPHLMKGMPYSDACAEVDYDHTRTQRVALEQIRNPVVTRCLRRSIKQTEILIRQLGCRPEAIHVELLRDVGKSADARAEMTRGLKKRTDAKNQNREEFLELIAAPSCSGNALMMYELLKEQNHQCVYCGKSIKPTEIVSGENSVQVDHIYPRGRSYDDSFVNKTLCCVGCNQKKRDQTPWECWKNDAQRWAEIEARVNLMTTCKREKKRRFFSKTFHEREQDFWNATRWTQATPRARCWPS